MEQDGVGSRLSISAQKLEDGCKRELAVFKGVLDKTNLPAMHRGENGVKFKINQLQTNLTHIGVGAFHSCSGLTEIAFTVVLTGVVYTSEVVQ